MAGGGVTIYRAIRERKQLQYHDYVNNSFYILDESVVVILQAGVLNVQENILFFPSKHIFFVRNPAEFVLHQSADCSPHFKKKGFFNEFCNLEGHFWCCFKSFLLRKVMFKESVFVCETNWATFCMKSSLEAILAWQPG